MVCDKDNPEDKKEEPQEYILKFCDFKPAKNFDPKNQDQWRLLKAMD